MEELIEQIPESRRRDPNDTPAGFTLRFSVGRNMWVCGYGRQLIKGKDTKRKDWVKYVGTGYSPIEALDDFVNNKLKNHTGL